MGFGLGKLRGFEYTIIPSLKAGARGGENSKYASVPAYATLIIVKGMRSIAAAARTLDAKATGGGTLWGQRGEHQPCL